MAEAAQRRNPDGYVHARDDAEYQAPTRPGAAVAKRDRGAARPRRTSTRHELPRCRRRPGRGDAADGRPGGARRPRHRHRDRRRARRPGSRRSPRARGRQFRHRSRPTRSTVEALPGAPFDLTYCRLFLMHMPEPVAALERMLYWTKPGGVVVAQEFDFGAIAVEPLCPAMTEFNRLFEGVFRGHGRNLRAGRQLPAQFEGGGPRPPRRHLGRSEIPAAQGAWRRC